MSSIVIAVSGASHSGKTTFIEGVKSQFGEHVILYDEVIRRYTKNIDEIRKNSKKYFELQLVIICEKIEQELKALIIKESDENKIILIDRSLIDSLYYYTQYVDVNNLSEVDLKKYYVFVDKIINHIEYSFTNIYDKVIFFEPIDSSKNLDPMRPKDISLKQNLESFLIRSVLKGVMVNTKTIDKFVEVDVTKIDQVGTLLKCIQNDLNKATTSCNSGWSNFLSKYITTVDKSFVLSNVITNCYGSIRYNPKEDRIKPFLFSGLFSENVEESNEILELCKLYNVESEWNDSRCHPTGLFKKNNIMLVGEAPGQKGRAIDKNMLKPSFIFTTTSAILRYSIMSDKHECPYITNLLKYAKPNNKVSSLDFKDNFNIFLRELELIQPSKIIALGKNAHSYLIENAPREYIDKIKPYTHPAAVTYKGVSEENVQSYKNLFPI